MDVSSQIFGKHLPAIFRKIWALFLIATIHNDYILLCMLASKEGRPFRFELLAEPHAGKDAQNHRLVVYKVHISSQLPSGTPICKYRIKTS